MIKPEESHDSHDSFLQGARKSVVFSGHGDTEPAWQDVLKAFVVGAVFYLIVELVLLLVKQRKKALLVFGILGGHIGSFLCSDAWAVTQEVDPWKKSVGMSILWVLVSIAFGFSLVAAAHFIRDRFVSRDGELDDKEEAWLRQSEEFEDEFMAFTVGLLITQVIRFALLGELVSYHGVQQHKDNANVWRDIWLLYTLAILFSILSLLISLANVKFALEGFKQRALVLGARMCSMTSSWSFLFFGKWFFWEVRGTDNVSDNVVPLTVMACIFMLVGLIIVSTIEMASRKYKFQSCVFLVLLEINTFTIGLAWESVFKECIEQWAEGRSSTASGRLGWEALAAGVTAIIVIPAWALYILPNVEGEGEGLLSEKKENEHETQRPFSERSTGNPEKTLEKL